MRNTTNRKTTTARIMNKMNMMMRMQMTMCCSEYVVRQNPYVSSLKQSCND